MFEIAFLFSIDFVQQIGKYYCKNFVLFGPNTPYEQDSQKDHRNFQLTVL